LTAGSKSYALTLTKGTSAYTVGSSLSVSAVPEPNTIALLLIGGGVLIICRVNQVQQATALRPDDE
jgi:PEP-CTERM motif